MNILGSVKKISYWSVNNPKKAIGINIFIALFLLILVVLPFIYSIPLNKFSIDTDPENMLSESEEARVFNKQMQKEFAIYDILVVGVINNVDANGVFNAKSLGGIHNLTKYIKDLDGVISSEVISPSSVDSIKSAGNGVINFNWLMEEAPKNDAEAMEIYENAKRIPFLNGTVVSQNGKAVAIYIPIASKNQSYKIAQAIKEKAKQLNMDDEIYISGLPIAQDQFGVEMFKQMMISAPLAMLLIFILMLLFFKNIKLISSSMIVSGVAVIITMCLLVITGNTVHIMSSMIPIFIAPIAVLNAVHLFSDFFESYNKYSGDKKNAIIHSLDELFMPMIYTSLTTMVGFMSLAFTPIPPVQVFGIFVGLGVFFAWLTTITFIPAYIMLIKDSSFKNFGATSSNDSLIAKLLIKMGHVVYKKSKLILSLAFVIVLISIYGITKISINDNPVKWFEDGHEIRIADKKFNENFAGTYMAYLAIEAVFDLNNTKLIAKKYGFEENLINGKSVAEVLSNLRDYGDSQTNSDDIHNKIDLLEEELQTFKQPEALAYIDAMQDHLLKSGLVGKSSSIVDMVKTIHRDLYNGSNDYFSIPQNSRSVGQVLLTYQNSHRPNDLWHFVNPNFTKANLWIQLKNGDNQFMQQTLDSLNEFRAKQVAPYEFSINWYGTTYINLIWQDKMVKGMLYSFIGSFLIVMLLMTLVFRSALWGLVSMMPLSITIILIYASIGFVGKDYDMPIAVLSSLSLGLAIDYAIHFLARLKEVYKKNSTLNLVNTWEHSLEDMFKEPSRAIFKNIIIISIGFMPLLFAPLVPYKTVGMFISAILFAGGLVTLVILPAIISNFEAKFFTQKTTMSNATKISIAIMVIAVILQSYLVS
jgi:predicted RND superfamily exporter protein